MQSKSKYRALIKQYLHIHFSKLRFKRNLLRNDIERLPNHVRFLTLSHTLLSWSDFSEFWEPHFPELQELNLGFNEIKTLSSITNCNFRKLCSLNLECNQISRWEELFVLTDLPCLKCLHVQGNKIKSVKYSHGFENLETLNISDNPLHSWDSMAELARFPRLVNLKVRGISVRDIEDDAIKRMVWIARIPKLEILNGSSVCLLGF